MGQVVGQEVEVHPRHADRGHEVGREEAGQRAANVVELEDRLVAGDLHQRHVALRLGHGAHAHVGEVALNAEGVEEVGRG